MADLQQLLDNRVQHLVLSRRVHIHRILFPPDIYLDRRTHRNHRQAVSPHQGYLHQSQCMPASDRYELDESVWLLQLELLLSLLLMLWLSAVSVLTANWLQF